MSRHFILPRLTKTARRTVLLLILTLSIVGLYRHGSVPGATADSAKVSKRRRCLPALQNDVAIILKTGTSEAFEKLPTQLQTALSCVENLLIVSDLDLDFRGHRLHDALAAVDQTVRDSDPAFQLYHEQRRLRDEGWTLHQMSNSLDPSSPSRDAAWKLDKFKFLHALDLAQRELPGMKWYYFMESDTYLVLPNLLTWLQRLDHRQKLFIGSPDYIVQNRMRFNHGGPGYLLSGSALRTATLEHSGLAAEWDAQSSQWCCGDMVLSVALNGLGIHASGAWPMFSRERPLQLPFNPSLWCQPAISLHHVSPADIWEMWQLEEQFDFSKRPLLFQDIYDYWLPKGLPRYRSGWENSMDGNVCAITTEVSPHSATLSIDACSQACENSPSCMQFLYRNELECTLYKCFALGTPITVAEGPQWESGWKVDRINAQIVHMRASCTTDEWVPHSTDNARSGGVNRGS